MFSWNRNLALLLPAQLLSQVGDKLLMVAMIWLLGGQYGEVWIPWYVAIGGLPHCVMAWWTGAIVNAIGAKRIVVWADFIRGVLYLVFPVIFIGDTPALGALLALNVLVNFGAALFNPAILALPPFLVGEELRPRANAAVDMCFSIANIVGPALSVLVYAWVGLRGLMVINGLTYLVAAGLQVGLKIMPLPIPEAGDGKASASSPWGLLRKEPLVRLLLFAFLGINLFGAPLVMYLPLYARDVYGTAMSGLATLEAVFGVGAVAGAIILSLSKASPSLGRRIVVAVLGVAAAFGLFAVSRSLLLGAVAIGLLGVAMALANIWILTLFQSVVAARDVTVVMALVNIIFVAVGPASLGIAGLLLTSVSVTRLACVSAAAVAAIAISIPFIPRLREV